jgi:HPt (histidine-containing phosphotransfer) domain-containing protein
MKCSAILDPRLGVERTFGIEGLWQRALETLIADIPSSLAEIEAAFVEKSHQSLMFLAHKLHGAAIFCGAIDLQNTARSLELACVDAPDQIESRLGKLKSSIAALNAFVDTHGIPHIG